MDNIKITPIDHIKPTPTPGIDYTNLQNLLAAANWKEANTETQELMLKVANRKKQNWLDINSINNLSCSDLRILDNYWVKYSHNNFGFSVQQRIWQEEKEDYGDFGDRVGWRVYRVWQNNKEMRWLDDDSLKFSIDAPQGHLPTVGLHGNVWRGMGGVQFYLRVKECKLS